MMRKSLWTVVGAAALVIGAPAGAAFAHPLVAPPEDAQGVGKGANLGIAGASQGHTHGLECAAKDRSPVILELPPKEDVPCLIDALATP